MTGSLLKLRAKDAEDVQIISAVLQDSIVPVCDMLYRPEAKNFVMVAQRLCRENDATEHPERICCAANFSNIASVQTHGIDLHHHDRMLDLLMMVNEGDSLTMLFAGDAKIRLDLAADWSMILEDFGEPWPTACNPCHEGQAGIKL